MKYIKITKGENCIVDDDDFEQLNEYSWHATVGGYACRRKTIRVGKNKIVYMHREIAKTPEGLCTDHINGNKLDNRKCNLRVCTRSENLLAFKKKKVGTSSRFIGVSWKKEKRKWEAYLDTYSNRKRLGYFTSEFDAAIARDKASIERGLDFLNLNYKVT